MASKSFVPPTPPFRSLRGFALDPSLSTTLDTAAISQVVLRVPWEELKPGPVGKYLEVVDVDPASECCYEPVDLNDLALLAQDGLLPSEGIPQFHQQMVYAVASLTIQNFERALGRWALWRPGPPPGHNPRDDSHYVPRLRIYPHALREANAYYSPQKIALLFGYFNASNDDPGNHMPGSRVFTCLSHDIIAHETTHALLDGMHRKFLVASNPDVRAFHEAFADIVALFQHFTFPEILRHQIARTRGDIRAHASLLGSLASQFGQASGRRGALREAIGRTVNGKWVPHKPDPAEYRDAANPGDAHGRGAILVAAIFDAFLSIYQHRVADLLRLATGGTGVLKPGAIHPDLVNRLADEARKSAQHVLTMCIRALDYCPPTDITFSEYLRAILTADKDLVPDDDMNYRVAFVEAFRRRGIHPPDLRTLSIETLIWRRPEDDPPGPSEQLAAILGKLRADASRFIYTTDREQVFEFQHAMRKKLHGLLKRHFGKGRDGLRDARFLGIDPTLNFEVHTGRIAIRASPDGGVVPQLLIGLLQSSPPAGGNGGAADDGMSFEGGSTLVADLKSLKVEYCIRKNFKSAARRARQQEFMRLEDTSLRSTYLGHRASRRHVAGGVGEDGDEPFALLHRGF